MGPVDGVDHAVSIGLVATGIHARRPGTGSSIPRTFSSSYPLKVHTGTIRYSPGRSLIRIRMRPQTDIGNSHLPPTQYGHRIGWSHISRYPIIQRAYTAAASALQRLPPASSNEMVAHISVFHPYRLYGSCPGQIGNHIILYPDMPVPHTDRWDHMDRLFLQYNWLVSTAAVPS